MESEYLVASEGPKEALWLRRLLSDMGYKLGPTRAHCDSQFAIRHVKNPVLSHWSHRSVLFHASRMLRARCDGHGRLPHV